ncbi:MAG: WecB/TagA/CpsF family glycosyltransferase [Firmicutes bacterium]|nr:WecB/TagA/CpsF family glycosyltransferase [Bacillota bacterium]
MADFKVVKILGVRVDKVTKAQALEAFRRMLDGDSCELIVTPNAEIVEKASKTPQLRRIINEEAALVTPDGVGLIYASRLKGDPIEEKVAGIDFARSAIELCAQLGRSVYLLGSKPGVAEAAAANLEKEIPGLKIAGFRDGYFKDEEESSVVEEINASGADFLCVALGSPKQEYFVIRHRDSLKVKAAAGLGGSLDIWSGQLNRAPAFYIDHGLEWLYRMIQEPRRLKRLPALPVFLIKAAIRR